MTKAELEQKLAESEARNKELVNNPPKPTVVTQSTVIEPVAGYLNINRDNARVSVIFNSAQIQEIVASEKQGHAGYTMRFSKEGVTTRPFMNTFEGAKKHGVNLPSMHRLLKETIEYKAGDFSNLLEEAHA